MILQVQRKDKKPFMAKQRGVICGRFYMQMHLVKGRRHFRMFAYLNGSREPVYLRIPMKALKMLIDSTVEETGKKIQTNQDSWEVVKRRDDHHVV